MTDLLPGFRSQLQRRAGELDRIRSSETVGADGADRGAYVAAAEPLAEHGRRRRRWGRPHGRGLAVVVLVAGASVGGLAYAAATTLWQPQLGSPDGPAGAERPRATASSPSNEQLRSLGVLRRAQTDLDRNVGSRYALKMSAGTGERIRTNAVRRLGTGTGGGVIVLIPYERKLAMIWPTPGSGQEPTDEFRRDYLCLNYVTPYDGAGVTCSTTNEMLSGRLALGLSNGVCHVEQQRKAWAKAQEREDRWARLEGRPAVRIPCDRGPTAGRADHWVGLVPDGVAYVQIGKRVGARRVPVRANLWQAESPVGNPRDHVWLDAAGQPISRKRADLRARLGLPLEPPRGGPGG